MQATIKFALIAALLTVAATKSFATTEAYFDCGPYRLTLIGAESAKLEQNGIQVAIWQGEEPVPLYPLDGNDAKNSVLVFKNKAYSCVRLGERIR